ncbi:MAG: hypothetical protein H5T61_13025 [Thermoflexales bacterium]|nr:hypothetical protein [Thermoflexales bacterium]
MKGKVLLFVLSLGLLLAVTGSVALTRAQGPEPPEGVAPQEVSIAATVSSKFSYQGVLKEGGNPVTGNRNMTFRLYSDSACTAQVGSDIVKTGVPVSNGLFSVDLSVTHSNFNGQGLWLKVLVGGTDLGMCQEILPVPYALSLKPGAIISDTMSYVELNRFMGTISPPTSWKYGMYAKAEGATYNYGVYASGSTAAVYADGDVKQSRTDDGLVKAGVNMNCGSGYILCLPNPYFNNVNDVQITGVCGATAGRCSIDFGFNINDRYWVATAVGNTDVGITCQLGSANDTLDCFRYDASSGGGSDGSIMVLIY